MLIAQRGSTVAISILFFGGAEFFGFNLST
jgi:hypothetical protein